MTRYLGLAEYFWLAEQVTAVDVTTLVKASRVELADSALQVELGPAEHRRPSDRRRPSVPLETLRRSELK